MNNTIDPIEAEKRKQELFFEVADYSHNPALANPEVLTESEEIENFLGKVLGFVAGAVVGALTGGAGWALVGAIAQGAATGFALGSIVDGLFSSSPDDAKEPQKLANPTYSINSAGSEALAKKGQIIPLIYTSDLHPTGGVRYLGDLLYSKMENENNNGRLYQLYSLGFRGMGGTPNLKDTVLINERRVDEILSLGEAGSDDELDVNFIANNNNQGMNAPFALEYSQAVNPSQLQSFGYKFITQSDTDNNRRTLSKINLPGTSGFDTNDNEINKFNVFLLNKKFVYGIYTAAGGEKFEQFTLDDIDTRNYNLTANRSLDIYDRNKILEVHKFKYSTTKPINKIVFSLDATLFGKDLVPAGKSNQP